jgi:hypothetical protein
LGYANCCDVCLSPHRNVAIELYHSENHL